MPYQTVPLTSDPNQSFQISLTIDGENRVLLFDIIWNDISDHWIMTIADPLTNTIILDSTPMLVGINMLSQFAYLRIGSAYLVNISDVETNIPTNENLGTDFHLVWGDTVI